MIYRKYYQYDQIKGVIRKTIETIPEEAFREAIANALVHRTWDVMAHTNVAMFPDRIEITSPGGLPQGMEEADYYKGGISVLRNRIIATVFFRLGMIERFGTGIRRIIETYKESSKKPCFEIRESSIKAILPVIEEENGMTPDEQKVYQLVKGKALSSSSVAEATGFGRSKAISILQRLVQRGYARVSGVGRGTVYTVS